MKRVGNKYVGNKYKTGPKWDEILHNIPNIWFIIFIDVSCAIIKILNRTVL